MPDFAPVRDVAIAAETVVAMTHRAACLPTAADGAAQARRDQARSRSRMARSRTATTRRGLPSAKPFAQPTSRRVPSRSRASTIGGRAARSALGQTRGTRLGPRVVTDEVGLLKLRRRSQHALSSPSARQRRRSGARRCSARDARQARPQRHARCASSSRW